MSPRGLMAELYGKATGVSGGRGGSMHLADFSIGFIGTNGIVGASVGLALGDAFAAHHRGEPRIAVASFGDGGVNTGRTWEFVNLASAWKLPLVVVCENNLYAVETTTRLLTGGDSIVRRAEGFGLPAASVDGQDVLAVRSAVSDARDRALAGDGPTFIEARTYRFGGHGAGEGPSSYRDGDEVDRWSSTQDPIERLRSTLSDAGSLTDEGYTALLEEAAQTVQDAVEFAEESPWPTL
jgi:TPP-dependent pyruvate/acetoin dehydrogenase alpha subunit